MVLSVLGRRESAFQDDDVSFDGFGLHCVSMCPSVAIEPGRIKLSFAALRNAWIQGLESMVSRVFQVRTLGKSDSHGSRSDPVPCRSTSHRAKDEKFLLPVHHSGGGLRRPGNRRDHVGAGTPTLRAEMSRESRLPARWRDNRDPFHRAFTARALRIEPRWDRFHAASIARRPTYAMVNTAHSQTGHDTFA